MSNVCSYNPCLSCYMEYDAEKCAERCTYGHAQSKLTKLELMMPYDQIIDVLNGVAIPLAALNDQNLENTYQSVSMMRALKHPEEGHLGKVEIKA